MTGFYATRIRGLAYIHISKKERKTGKKSKSPIEGNCFSGMLNMLSRIICSMTFSIREKDKEREREKGRDKREGEKCCMCECERERQGEKES